MRLLVLGIFALIISLSVVSEVEASEKCEVLARTSLSSASEFPLLINQASVVPAGDDLPSYCQVQGIIAPQIGFEVRLPTENWNGKFLMQGCGGLCGIINMAAAEDALARGYAVTNTDMGHKGQPFSAIWAYNNRAAEIDFGYRATHATAVTAKALVEVFYSRAPDYSYFRGCSTGGRQGMVEAQRYPDDFDGIISGAPVLNELGDGMYLNWSIRANIDAEGNQIVAGETLDLVHKEVLAQCDALDGLEDGLLQDPKACDFNILALACDAESRTQCLTPPEIEVFRKIYDGPRNSKGEKLFPGGLPYGSEYEWAPAFMGLEGKPSLGSQMPLVSDMLRYMAYPGDPGPSIDMYDFDFDLDPPRFKYMEKIYTASNPDLSAYKESGGKIIMYHGWDDIEVPALNTIDYYEKVEAVHEDEEVRDFYRLFLMPGMAHCRRGPGPDAVDYLAALEAWVERDEEPEFLEAAHLVKEQAYNGLPRLRYPLSEDAYDYTRPIYPYPEQAIYSGSGDVTKASSWKRKGD